LSAPGVAIADEPACRYFTYLLPLNKHTYLLKERKGWQILWDRAQCQAPLLPSAVRRNGTLPVAYSPFSFIRKHMVWKAKYQERGCWNMTTVRARCLAPFCSI